MKQPFEGVLEQLQDRVYQELRRQHDFQKICIMEQKRSSLSSLCEQLIQRQLGEGIFITAPLPKKIVSDVPGPVYEQIVFSVQVIENITINRSGHSALSIAERIAQQLHLKEFVFGNQRWTVRCNDKDPWTFEWNDGENIITLNFSTQYSF